MSEQDEHLAVHAELCRHEKGVVGGGISTIIALRARVADLEAETEVWRTSNAALTSECLTLRARVAEWKAVYEQCDKSRDELHDKLGAALARVAELEAAWTKENNVAGKFEGELQVAEASVAELEGALRPLMAEADKQAALLRHRAKDSTSGVARALIENAQHLEKLREAGNNVLTKGRAT